MFPQHTWTSLAPGTEGLAPGGVNPDCKIHGTNVEPTWGRQDPGGPRVGHMNFGIWDAMVQRNVIY